MNARKQNRRDAIKIIAVGATAMAMRPLGKSWGAGARPNILWLVSEDNNPWLGCYGDSFATTPNLDRLAGEGILFSNFFANAPVCAPARSTIHTGMYPPGLGTEHMRSMNPLPGHVRFFTEYLRKAGYYCVNGQKTDYNTTGTPRGAWDARNFSFSLNGLKTRQPFFRFINFSATHESSLFKSSPVQHDPAGVKLAPYHPDTPAIRHDYAQYYDQIAKLDTQIGAILQELEQEGLAGNTILFYFSDNGGVLPRSKRFLYDSGMSVPLIIRFPKEYQSLAPVSPGKRPDRLASYIDLAPTMLSLASVPIPANMQGRAFLGEQTAPEPEYVHGYRGRMDELYDLSRAVRNRHYKYIRNYYPHLPWGRRLDFLWRMPAMQSWEEEYKKGTLNTVQARFFGPKPAEELYNLADDPYEINNLAGNPAYRNTLERMREINRGFMLEIRDTGMLQEGELSLRSIGSTPYETAQDEKSYNLQEIMAAAETASQLDPGRVADLIELLAHPDNGVRYWGAVGCSALEDKAEPAVDRLERALRDESPAVRIAAAEALAKLGRTKAALSALQEALEHKNIFVALYAVDAVYNIGEAATPALESKRKKVAGRTGLATNFNATR